MKEKSKVELCERIRRGRRLEDVSVSELSKRHGVHRRTVRQALESAIPARRKIAVRVRRPGLPQADPPLSLMKRSHVHRWVHCTAIRRDSLRRRLPVCAHDPCRHGPYGVDRGR